VEFYFPVALQPDSGSWLSLNGAPRLHSLDTPHLVGLLWKNDQPDTETSTWQHSTLARDKHHMLPSGFEPPIPANKRPQTHLLDQTATAIGKIRWYMWRGCVICGAQMFFFMDIVFCCLVLGNLKGQTRPLMNVCHPSTCAYICTQETTQ